MLLFKILRQAEWDVLDLEGESEGSPDDLRDGYIHLSTAKQIEETAKRHFEGEDGLMLLALEDLRLKSLRWEVSRGGTAFPHLYAKMLLTDVVWARQLPLIEGDVHDFTGLI